MKTVPLFVFVFALVVFRGLLLGGSYAAETPQASQQDALKAVPTVSGLSAAGKARDKLLAPKDSVQLPRQTGVRVQQAPQVQLQKQGGVRVQPVPEGSGFGFEVYRARISESGYHDPFFPNEPLARLDNLVIEPGEEIAIVARGGILPSMHCKLERQGENNSAGGLQTYSKLVDADLARRDAPSTSLPPGSTYVCGIMRGGIRNGNDMRPETIQVRVLSPDGPDYRQFSSFQLNNVMFKTTWCGEHYEYLPQDSGDSACNGRFDGIIDGRRAMGGYTCRFKDDYPPEGSCPEGTRMVRVSHSDAYAYYCLSDSNVSPDAARCAAGFRESLSWLHYLGEEFALREQLVVLCTRSLGRVCAAPEAVFVGHERTLDTCCAFVEQ